MALNFMAPERKELTPRITVFGVGGAGGNAVNNMIDKSLEGVEFVVANTDAQALAQSKAPHKIQLGVKATEGLGAGAKPTIGAAAAEETLEEIIDHLSGAHMCFITAGMGGGTGTGAAPIIAQAAREMGVLTVGVVTKPFLFEGLRRMRQAEEGVEALQKVVDTLIIIPNQNLFRLANDRTTFAEAFALADNVLYQGVKGVTDLMVRPGMINLDFADVRAVMDEMGKAMMGTGDAEGVDRARNAAEAAIANPLLDEISLHGARGVLINITGGHDLTLFELDEAANLIREKVDPEANIIVGSTLDPEMNGRIRVSVVATGIESVADATTLDVPRRRLSEPLIAPASVQTAEPAPVAAPEVAPVTATVAPPPLAPVARHPDAAPHQDEFDLEAVYAPAPMPTFSRAQSPRAPTQNGNGLAPLHQPAPHHGHSAQAPAARHIPAPLAPEPAWQPDPEWDLPAAAASHEPTDIAALARARHPEAYPEPVARRAGTPSPEVVERLRRAVENRPAPPAPAPVAQAESPARGRFGGLGSLITRMTGQADVPAAPARAQPSLQQPVPQSWDEVPAPRAQEDRVEIPAFLRRQAN
jgi:cell division protein FtsZ